jgi:hypothetical protein
MADINDYVRALFWNHLARDFAPPGGFVRSSHIVEAIRNALVANLTIYEATDVTDTQALAHEVFGLFASQNLLVERADPFAGKYYQVATNRLNKFRQQWVETDPVLRSAGEIGQKFFPDVFGGYRGVNPLNEVDQAILNVPASDRIVALSHNQVDELEQPVEELIVQLERDNGIPDEPGVKERLLGQVKAGRELLRAGNFRVYLLHITLIKALGELIERYKGTAIAMVAASLVDLLVKTVLQVQ